MLQERSWTNQSSALSHVSCRISLIRSLSSFQGAKRRELITGGVADAHLAIDGRELLGDTAREFVIQRFQRAVR